MVANSEKSYAVTHPVQPHAKAARSRRPSRRRGTSDGINRPHGPQSTVAHHADIQRARGGLLARCAASGARQTQAHLASVREAAAAAAAAHAAPPRAASRVRAPLDAPSRRRLDEHLAAAAGPLGGH